MQRRLIPMSFIIKSTFFFIALILLNKITLFAQLKADFTADNTTGCMPSLLVHFKNTTQNASAGAVYKWDFGNGNSSNQQSPGASFITAKDFTVTLTVTDGAQTSSKSMTITVHANPTADFTISGTRGCLPLNTTLTSTSNAGESGATITKYFWDFGDGFTSNTTSGSATHSYNTALTASLGLTVTNNFGCQSDPVQKNNAVTVLPAVKATFAADKTVLCKLTDAVKLTNTSTGPGTLSYAWDYGDGTNGTDLSPLHNYTAKGNYTVKLSVTSSEGCSASYTLPTPINAANFTSDITLPALICTNSNVTFTLVSNPTPTSSIWSFSDNQSGYYYNQRTFGTPGNYTVTLTNTFGTCQDVVQKSFTVNQSPNLNGFIIDNGGSCGAPTTVKFTDTTKAAVKWAWDFTYNYGSANVKATTQTASYAYTSDSYYNINLMITDAVGCTASVTKSLYVQKPSVYINYTNAGNNNCEGMTLSFSSAFNNPVNNDVIKTYSWSFGDGSTSADAAPKHTYATAGSYNVSLNFVTASGCTGTASVFGSISVYQKPKADFKVSSTQVCGNTPDYFTNTSTPAGTSSYWNFGDGGSSYGYSSGYSIAYQYSQAGVYSVRMIAQNGNCYDTITKTNLITVLPPFPKVASVTNTCADTRGLVTLTHASRLATDVIWDYGDGSATQSYAAGITQTIHTYTQTGTYKVVVTAINGQCSVRDSMTAYVLLKQNPILSTTHKDTICINDQLDVKITGLVTNPGYNATYYQYNINYGNWKYADGTSFSGSTYTSNNGFYNSTSFVGTLSGLQAGKTGLRVIVTSAYFNCQDTSNLIPIKAFGPLVGFKLTSNNVCYKSPIVLTDTSKPTNNIPLKKWEWAFGDNTTQTATVGGVMPHIYATPGYYYPTLKVTDSLGCFASTSSYLTSVYSGGPKADFSWSPANIAPNVNATFSNTTIDPSNYYSDQYKWLFKYDNYSLSTASYYTTVPRNYPNIMVDTVTLIAINPTTKCTDTITKFVPIRNINTSFTYTTQYINNNSCPPMVAYFRSSSLNVNSLKWDFGDGSTGGNNASPSHTYTKPGKYVITLYAYGDNGIIVTASDSFIVKGPYAVIQTDIVRACTPATVTMNAVVMNASSFTWDLGDGTLSATTDTFVVHTYTNPGVYSPAMIMKDVAGCTSTIPLGNPIIMDSLHFSIKGSPHEVCDSGFVNFITKDLYSVAASNIPDSALRYEWSFGTGNVLDSSHAPSPAFKYTALGKYEVKLHVESLPGCVFNAIDSIIVKESSRATISGPTEVCEDLKVQFNATPSIPGSVDWKWIFDNGKTDNKQLPDQQVFKGSATPRVVRVITTYNGCLDTTDINLTVHFKPAINLSPAKPVICLGDSVKLHAEDGITYNWSPALNLSNPTDQEPYASPKKTSQYKVKVTNAFTCENMDSVIVTVAQPFKMDLSKDTFVCVGSNLRLRASGADTYLWTTGTNDLNNNKVADPLASPKANAVYTVVGYDAYNCFTDTGKVTVTIRPLPTINAGQDITVPVGSTVPLSALASSDVVGYEWLPSTYLDCSDCATPISTPRSNISYVVTGKTQYGCTASDTVSITLTCVDNTVFIPTAFTPNGDGKNEVFYPLGRGIRNVKRFAIYSKWGEILFERSNFNINDRSSGWNGRFKGNEMPTGVYVYTIELECDTGEPFSLKGTVTLIR